MRYVLLLLVFVLAGCLGNTTHETFALSADQLHDIKRKVAFRLKDPQSAQFRNIVGRKFTNNSGRVQLRVCGEVNAKNSFGGYVGYRPFSGYLDGGHFFLSAIAKDDTLATSLTFLEWCGWIRRSEVEQLHRAFQPLSLGHIFDNRVPRRGERARAAHSIADRLWAYP